MKITNKDIYDLINRFKKETREHFDNVDRRLEVTNGKVKLNRWIATTALTSLIAICLSLIL